MCKIVVNKKRTSFDVSVDRDHYHFAFDHTLMFYFMLQLFVFFFKSIIVSVIMSPSLTTSSSSSSRGYCQSPMIGGLSLWILIASNLLIFQLAGLYYNSWQFRTIKIGDSPYPTSMMMNQQPPNNNLRYQHPILDLPQGQAIALPSIRVDDNSSDNDITNGDNVDSKRIYYGGRGDKPHLGGFANQDIDMDGVSPAAWKYMVKQHGIKSLLDVGCGRGISTSWFYYHGVDAHCVEGSHDAVQQSVLAESFITEHDFSRGYVMQGDNH